MKITNKLNLPDEIVSAVSTREPSGSYSASMLTKTPRMVWLNRRHYSEMSEDVTERIWSLFGTAVHAVLAESESEQSINEQYLSHIFEDGNKISGMADVYKNGKISDWKVKSVWSVVYFDDESRFELESQLNTYAFLFSKAGFSVEALEAVFILRDWQQSKDIYDQNYPQSQVVVIPIQVWGEEETEEYIRLKIANFEKYKEVPDNELPECTPKERWAKPPKWALMKKGRKRAVKLFDEKPAGELEPDHFWEERKGEMFKRCEYCSARDFCNQYQEREK